MQFMKLTNHFYLTVSVVMLLLCGAALGQDSYDRMLGKIENLEKKISTQESQLHQLRKQAEETWFNDQQVEAIKGLVRDVLTDADTRSNLLGSVMTAGHDGKHFYLASADGSFRLNIAGQIQMRYIANFRNNDDRNDKAIDQDELGFQIRRSKLKFTGHIGNPRFTYKFVLAADRKVNDVGLEDVVIGYKVNKWLTVAGGRQKLPFLREELTSSTKQLAVDRATVSEFFTLNRGEGIWFELGPFDDGTVKSTLAISDGANSGNIGGGATGSNDFDKDNSNIAFTGRVVKKIGPGSWKQMKDYTAWAGEKPVAFIGAAVHYEVGETGADNNINANYLAYTVDGSIEVNRLNIMAAYMASHTTFDDGTSDLTHRGVLVQGGYQIIPDKLEPFARYELIDIDGVDGTTSLIGGGFNYYLKKHNIKFTLDCVYALDPLVSELKNEPYGADGVSGGLGLRKDDGNSDGQFTIRAQFQILF